MFFWEFSFGKIIWLVFFKNFDSILRNLGFWNFQLFSGNLQNGMFLTILMFLKGFNPKGSIIYCLTYGPNANRNILKIKIPLKIRP